MSGLSDMSFDDPEDMPVQGVSGVSADCQAQLCPDSMSGYEYYLAQQRAEQRKVHKDFLAILETVKAGQYSNLKEFATAMGKSLSWANSFRRAAISTHCLTGMEWRACFRKGEHGNG
jgi:hypothetical protein